MNVKQMLAELGDIVGKNPDIPDDRSSLLRYLNRSAAILWPNDDMPMALRAQTIDAPPTNIICFPEFVGQVRGVRSCKVSRDIINIPTRFVDKMPEHCYVPTVLHKSAVSDNTVDYANLFVEFAAAVECPCTVTITGATASSSYKTKTLEFGKGIKTLPVGVAFISISNVYKNTLTGYDMRLMSGVDDEIAMVPSHANSSMYIVYQISDACCCVCDSTCRPCFELFYKPTLLQLSDDYNVFQADGVDQALIHYGAGLYRMKDKDADSQKQSQVFIRQALAILSGASRDNSIGKKAPIAMMRRGFFRPHEQPFYEDQH